MDTTHFSCLRSPPCHQYRRPTVIFSICNSAWGTQKAANQQMLNPENEWVRVQLWRRLYDPICLMLCFSDLDRGYRKEVAKLRSEVESPLLLVVTVAFTCARRSQYRWLVWKEKVHLPTPCFHMPESSRISFNLGLKNLTLFGLGTGPCYVA